MLTSFSFGLLGIINFHELKRRKNKKKEVRFTLHYLSLIDIQITMLIEMILDFFATHWMWWCKVGSTRNNRLEDKDILFWKMSLTPSPPRLRRWKISFPKTRKKKLKHFLNKWVFIKVTSKVMQLKCTNSQKIPNMEWRLWRRGRRLKLW